jgi:hypothetical protein
MIIINLGSPLAGTKAMFRQSPEEFFAAWRLGARIIELNVTPVQKIEKINAKTQRPQRIAEKIDEARQK